jgi:hypothetical protein
MQHGKTLLALSSLVLLGACAGAGQHRGPMGHGAQAPHAQMQGMHEQMRNARSMEECQALMQRHMQAMQPGMPMQPGMEMPQQMRDMCMQHMRNMPPAAQPGTGGTTAPPR